MGAKRRLLLELLLNYGVTQTAAGYLLVVTTRQSRAGTPPDRATIGWGLQVT